MHQPEFLKDLVIVLGAAVVVVALLRRLRVPVIAGFIVAGALTGPSSALRLIASTDDVNALAEIGVVLLLFGIGMELSLERVRRLWKFVLLGGGFQVIVTIAITAAASRWLGQGLQASIFIGCVVALSSTAVILRALAKRGELEAPHGRFAVGVLVFQDLSVVPMMLAVPFLAGQQTSSVEILETLAIAGLVIVGTVLAAMTIVPRLLSLVATTRERELFVLTVFLICFGTAWIVSLAGVSLALGAFLAGLVVAGSEYRHQALSELIPARELLASLFFVSVGMLLDLTEVITHIGPIALLVATIILGKALIIFISARLLRLPLRAAILSGAALCQIGEFSFVLLSAAGTHRLISSELEHNLLVAIVLSMLLTPLMMAVGPRLAKLLASLTGRKGARPNSAADTEELDADDDYVVIVGYGLCGQAVCETLQNAGTRCVVVDINPSNVRQAREDGHTALYGDVTQMAIMESAGCHDAILTVLCINDVHASELAVKVLKQVAPETNVIARANYEADRKRLTTAGACRVITSESAASSAMVAQTRLMLSGEEDTTHAAPAV